MGKIKVNFFSLIKFANLLINFFIFYIFLALFIDLFEKYDIIIRYYAKNN